MHNDTITLGQLSFTVKIIERPLEPDADAVSSTPGALVKEQDHAIPSRTTTQTDIPSSLLVSSEEKKNGSKIKVESPASHP
jgi:hypothetical protein